VNPSFSRSGIEGDGQSEHHGIDVRPRENEIVVRVLSEPDKFGRREFTAYWHDPKSLVEGGPTDHVRAQMFCTDLSAFEAVQQTRGGSVRFIDHEPTWEPAASKENVGSGLTNDDLRNVLGLAETVEDRTPQEQRSVDRLARLLETLDQERGRERRAYGWGG
jgi:hypothetical protein